MAKFYGPVGYAVDEEGGPDVIVEKPVEKFYKGDLVKNYCKTENSNELNDNITISNQISIVADAYAYSHMFAMRYVKWMGVAWEVTSVEAQPPRLILSLGGVYNGEIAQ